MNQPLVKVNVSPQNHSSLPSAASSGLSSTAPDSDGPTVSSALLSIPPSSAACALPPSPDSASPWSSMFSVHPFAAASSSLFLHGVWGVYVGSIKALMVSWMVNSSSLSRCCSSRRCCNTTACFLRFWWVAIPCACSLFSWFSNSCIVWSCKLITCCCSCAAKWARCKRSCTSLNCFCTSVSCLSLRDKCSFKEALSASAKVFAFCNCFWISAISFSLSCSKRSRLRMSFCNNSISSSTSFCFWASSRSASFSNTSASSTSSPASLRFLSNSAHRSDTFCCISEMYFSYVVCVCSSSLRYSHCSSWCVLIAL
mmetsp:Transcript_81987/g.144794  ORF Transcript_81987/g.144794 Transcript_81987/m.144794 type:complete len:312 (+) Transcript_81987:139-1074(+)